MNNEELTLTRKIYQCAIYIAGQITTIQELFDWRGEVMQEGINEMWADVLEVSLEDIQEFKIDIRQMPAKYCLKIADFLEISGHHVLKLVHNQLIEQGHPGIHCLPAQKVKIQ